MTQLSCQFTEWINKSVRERERGNTQAHKGNCRGEYWRKRPSNLNKTNPSGFVSSSCCGLQLRELALSLFLSFVVSRLFLLLCSLSFLLLPQRPLCELIRDCISSLILSAFDRSFRWARREGERGRKEDTAIFNSVSWSLAPSSSNDTFFHSSLALKGTFLASLTHSLTHPQTHCPLKVDSTKCYSRLRGGEDDHLFITCIHLHCALLVITSASGHLLQYLSFFRYCFFYGMSLLSIHHHRLFHYDRYNCWKGSSSSSARLLQFSLFSRTRLYAILARDNCMLYAHTHSLSLHFFIIHFATRWTYLLFPLFFLFHSSSRCTFYSLFIQPSQWMCIFVLPPFFLCSLSFVKRRSLCTRTG